MSKRSLGITFFILGILLTCCLCPLTLNNVLIYAQVDPYDEFLGPPVQTWTTTFQLLCSSLLALLVLIVGLVALVQSRSNGRPPA